MSDATTATAASDTTLMGGGTGTADATATTGATTGATGVDANAGKTDQTTTSDGKGATTTDATKADAKDGDGKDKPAGAPEKYEDFKLPEGAKADPAVMGEFATVAKELNLSQEQAQKLVDINAKLQATNVEQFKAAVEAQGEQWASAAKTDKEFGGDKFDENLAVAKKALDEFGTPELKTLLVQSKLGNHPEVLRFFYRAGQAISQDGFVPGRQGSKGLSAQGMYANSNMNP